MAKADLDVRWSKREGALLYHWGGNGHCKPSSMLLAHYLEHITIGNAYPGAGGRPEPGNQRSLAQELDARGYDLTTLKFSIRKKVP